MINYQGNLNFNYYITNGSSPPITCACMDQLCGKLINKKYHVIPRVDINYQQKGNNRFISSCLTNPIVVVLESPHVSEFDNQGRPRGPAYGTTGRLFTTKFEGLINSSKKIKLLNKHDVVLMNSVQYQCSLGNSLRSINNKKIRDDNWVSCFDNGCAQDLVYRINAIKPYAVINLCTKGLINLQMILHDQICLYNNYTYGTHPSTWNFSYAYIK